MAKSKYDTVKVLAEIPAENGMTLPIRIRLMADADGKFFIDIRKYRPAASAGKSDFYLSGITTPVSNVENIAAVINLVAEAVKENA